MEKFARVISVDLCGGTKKCDFCHETINGLFVTLASTSNEGKDSLGPPYFACHNCLLEAINNNYEIKENS